MIYVVKKKMLKTMLIEYHSQ